MASDWLNKTGPPLSAQEQGLAMEMGQRASAGWGSRDGDSAG